MFIFLRSPAILFKEIKPGCDLCPSTSEWLSKTWRINEILFSHRKEGDSTVYGGAFKLFDSLYI